MNSYSELDFLVRSSAVSDIKTVSELSVYMVAVYFPENDSSSVYSPTGSLVVMKF